MRNEGVTKEGENRRTRILGGCVKSLSKIDYKKADMIGTNILTE